MGSVRSRKETGTLFFDFIYRGERCREQTMLKDTPENRRKMDKAMKKIDAEILLDQFDYASYFPNSVMLKKFTSDGKSGRGAGVASSGKERGTPLLKDFAQEWFHENEVRWKPSYTGMVRSTLNVYLIPHFGETETGRITKGDILKFRASLAKVQNGTKQGLSPDRINHIITPLRMMLSDAADRYDFTTPFVGFKPLPVPRTEVDPFTLEEVRQILDHVRPDYRNYYTVRFFTGLRTGEIDGLKWKYVDFDRREILVRETVIRGVVGTTKTAESNRSIAMSRMVYAALKDQYERTGSRSEFVFSSRQGTPVDYVNVTGRIWYPLLRDLGLKVRRPYQTRHTAATLWLAAGESPEWIARQLGHANTKMLFTVYSRYVPNLTRQDGSAMERLIESRFQFGEVTP